MKKKTQKKLVPPVTSKRQPKPGIAKNPTQELKQKKVSYEEHWQNMPEFVQEDMSPVKSIIVNFRSNEDMHKFSKIVGQQITAKTRSIWYPEIEETLYVDKRWSDKPLPTKRKPKYKAISPSSVKRRKSVSI